MDNLAEVLKRLSEQAEKERELISREYAGITPQFTEKTFENYNTETESEIKLKNLCSDFVSGRTKQRSLMLVGSNGCGKTHLACAIGNAFISKNKKVRYLKSDSIHDQVRVYWQNDLTTDAFIKKLIQFDLVIIDDLGKEYSDKNEMNRQIMNQIIDRLYENKVRVVFTTNFNSSDITDKYGPAVLSRIMEVCMLINIGNTITDKRMAVKNVVTI